MAFFNNTEQYYQKFIELQERLRKSEEDRLQLEIKFSEMMQISREEEQAHYRKLRSKYKKFMEEDKKRQERNRRILLALERIESRISTIAAKTNRVKELRRQYQAYLERVGMPQQKLPRTEQNPAFNKSQNESKDEILQRYLRSMSKTKEANSEFNHDYANSIAEDIMASIYSSKDNSVKEPFREDIQDRFGKLSESLKQGMAKTRPYKEESSSGPTSIDTVIDPSILSRNVKPISTMSNQNLPSAKDTPKSSISERIKLKLFNLGGKKTEPDAVEVIKAAEDSAGASSKESTPLPEPETDGGASSQPQDAPVPLEKLSKEGISHLSYSQGLPLKPTEAKLALEQELPDSPVENIPVPEAEEPQEEAPQEQVESRVEENQNDLTQRALAEEQTNTIQDLSEAQVQFPPGPLQNFEASGEPQFDVSGESVGPFLRVQQFEGNNQSGRFTYPNMFMRNYDDRSVQGSVAGIPHDQNQGQDQPGTGSLFGLSTDQHLNLAQRAQENQDPGFQFPQIPQSPELQDNRREFVFGLPQRVENAHHNLDDILQRDLYSQEQNPPVNEPEPEQKEPEVQETQNPESQVFPVLTQEDQGFNQILDQVLDQNAVQDYQENQYQDYDQVYDPNVQYDQNQVYDENGQPYQMYDQDGQPIMSDQNGQLMQGYDPAMYNQTVNQYATDENYQYYENAQYDQQGLSYDQYPEQTNPPQYDPNQPEYGQAYPSEDPPQYQIDDDSGGILGQAQPAKQELDSESEGGEEKAKDKKPKVMDMLDTDTEESKQESKNTNESDFDYSNN